MRPDWYDEASLKEKFFYWLGVLILKVPRPLEQLGEYDKYRVIRDTAALWREGHMGVPCALVYEDGWGGKTAPTIAVNRLAQKLWPEWVLESVLAHEVGHIECGHLERFKEGETWPWCPAEEFEADRWAVEKHGIQYVRAMEFLRKWHDGEFIRERIKAVKRWNRYELSKEV